MMNARLNEAEQGLGGCWMMNGRQIGRSSHTLELEELGGLFEIRSATRNLDTLKMSVCRVQKCAKLSQQNVWL